jgi:hypothetical protein
MKKYLIVLICAFSLQIKAQNSFQWADSGAVWHYTYNGLTGLGYQKMTYQKDTIINNHAYQKIIRESQSSMQVSQGVFVPTPVNIDPSYFLYQSNDTVYTYYNGSFFMAFKTNATVGEIWELGNFSGIASNLHAYVKVDSVYFQTYNGVSLRNIKIHNCDVNGDSLDFTVFDTIPVAGISSPFLGGIINEKFGPMVGFNGINYTSVFFGVDEYIPQQILCYQSATFPFIQFGTSDCFNNIFVGIDEQVEDAIQIYPNPTHNELFINNAPQNSSIQIYNLQGQLLFAKSIQKQTIDIGNLSSGLYFYKIIDHNGNIKYSEKLMKE